LTCGQAKDNQRTTKGQPKDTNKKEKKVKKVKKEASSPDGDGLLVSTSVYSKDFGAWWEAYPRKVGKGKAAKAWRSAILKMTNSTTTPDQSKERLLETVIRFAASPKGQSGQFCPHPTTWLNEARYDDDPKEWNARSSDLVEPERKLKMFGESQ
jgi:hypothetical protein